MAGQCQVAKMHTLLKSVLNIHQYNVMISVSESKVLIGQHEYLSKLIQFQCQDAKSNSLCTWITDKMADNQRVSRNKWSDLLS